MGEILLQLMRALTRIISVDTFQVLSGWGGRTGASERQPMREQNCTNLATGVYSRMLRRANWRSCLSEPE